MKRSRASHLGVLLLGVLLLTGAAHAQTTSLTVTNPGFEQPPLAAGTFSTSAPPTGWQVAGSGIDFGFRAVGVLDPTGTSLYPGAAPEGENVGVVFLLDDPGDQGVFAGIEAGLQQTLAATLQPEMRYRLRVDVGNIADDPVPPSNAFQFAGFPGYRIELLAGGVPIALDANTRLPAEGAFETSTLEVLIGATHPQIGQPLAIRLLNLNAAPGLEVNFDDVRLEAEAVTAVPALGAFGLCALVLGLLGIAARAMNHRRPPPTRV